MAQSYTLMGFLKNININVINFHSVINLFLKLIMMITMSWAALTSLYQCFWRWNKIQGEL